MTSFLALRASVCAYLWCLIPPVCYIGRQIRPLSHMKRSLAGSLSASGEGRQFETCFDPYIFSHLSGLNFALGASSIRSSVLRQSPGACFVFVTGGSSLLEESSIDSRGQDMQQGGQSCAEQREQGSGRRRRRRRTRQRRATR